MEKKKLLILVVKGSKHKVPEKGCKLDLLQAFSRI